MTILKTVEQLEALYGTPGETSLVKELDRIIPEYAAFIEASPFVALATGGPEGLDCSPRGDLPGFVRIADERTLMMPDRHGNNRVDSLRNIVRDGRVGLLFLVPGSGTTLRVNGRAELSVDDELRASFAVDGKAPRSVIVIARGGGLFPVRPRHPPVASCGTRHGMSTRSRCRRRARSLPPSAPTGSAARPTTANGRSGRRRRCGRRAGVTQAIRSTSATRRM